MKVENIACYVRVSTEEQRLHGLSLDAQKMKLTEYAAKNNMHIVEWYVDEGVSGRKLIKNRPELQRMIQDAEQKKFSRIIFIKLDRFFRSVAEYHECMKRIAPVVWSTTEEEYDLTTANGRMLVNMKLTIAEMEADQTGERIRIVNDYKVRTGQPVVGQRCLPFGFTIGIDEKTGKKKVVRDPEKEEAVRDVIAHYLRHQSRKKSLILLNSKHGAQLSYKALKALLANTMLYGAYRDNPSYCEAYIDRETFDRIQEISSRNIKMYSEGELKHYLFSGLLICPECGSVLKGTIHSSVVKGNRYKYKRYRCPQNTLNHRCKYNKTFSENAFERLMLANIEPIMEQEKIRLLKIEESQQTVPQYDIESINAQIDRLNYAWQTGKIRTVEKYEADYEALLEKLQLAEEEKEKSPIADLSHIEEALQDGWKEIYKKLDDAHKRAFWRSFIRSIEVNWQKTIDKINFF